MSAPVQPHDTRAVPARDERPTAIRHDTDVAAPAAVTALPAFMLDPIGEVAA
ncbi:hypothetical protein [Promicromonospora sp. NPDC057488]|uniref:hypothetical protein n=1 Tax=Promicromonospora sp. NPDC057488 TaxID=3346147 RepID=UPI00366C2EC9